MAKLIQSVILATILIASAMFVVPNSSFAVILTEEDNKAKQDIIGDLSEHVDHKWSTYRTIIGIRDGENQSVIIYNKTGGIPEPPPICQENEHLENGVCVPNTPPPPTCNIGEIFNATSGKCEPLPPDENCPPSMIWNATSQKCEEIPMPPPIEVCGDGIDNNNNGQIDEGCPVIPPEPITIPKLNTSEWQRVGFVGDIDDNSAQSKQFNQFKALQVQFIGFSGDAGYKNLMNTLQRILDAGFSKDDVIGACGNHDSCSALAQWLGESNNVYAKEKGNILFVAMKGKDDMSNCGDSQVSQVDNLLQKNAEHKVILIHQPFMTVKSTHGNNDGFDCYHQEVFVHNGVDVVSQSHNHNKQIFIVDNIQYSVDGTGTHDKGNNMYPVGSNNDGQGHNVVFKKTGDNGLSIIDFSKNSDAIRGWYVAQDGKTILDSWELN